jgi:energy-coupling factor transport system ATP-binding protein
VVVDTHDISATLPHVLSRSAGLLLQQPDAQCFGTTVARDIAFGPSCQGLDRTTIAARVREAAAQLEVTPLLRRAPGTLSGGEQQRVALAGLLALRPRLLVLDEPFAFLDAAGAGRLRATLRRLHHEGVTIVVAEHRLDEVAADATRMVILQAGRVVADAPPRDVLVQDVAAWGLEAPPLIQLARAGQSAIPLTLDEAVDLFGGLSAPVDVRLPHLEAVRPKNRQGAPILSWEQVWCERDGRAVLRNIDLRIPAGTIVGVLGANGAGKSTLLRLANGLLRPHRGAVQVCGRPAGRRPVAELARDIGLVVQQPAHMLFAPTVRAEIEVGPRALRRYEPAWCATLIERFGLGSLLEQAPQRLSAGEQRRVALAAVLASRPRVLLLDEPTVGQDAYGRRTLHGLVEEVVQYGTTVVLATHDTEWAYPLATEWAVLADGNLVTNGSPAIICGQSEVVARARLRLPAIIALQHALMAREAPHGFHR